MAKRLTTITVENARPGPARREISDGGSGLYLVIQPSGAKSWALRYRFEGRPRKLTLPGFPNLATARRMASAALEKLDQENPTDPAAETLAKRQAAKEERSGESVRAVVERFIHRHVRPNNRPRSAVETERHLATVVSRWADRPIASITKKDVLALLDDIVDEGHRTKANRVLAAWRACCNWMLSRDLISVSPCAGVKPPSPETSRDRLLSDHEIRLFWRATESLGHPFCLLFRMLLLTGQRREEVGELRFSELDLNKRLWTLPGERSKNGEPNHIPLSDMALEIINGLRRIGTAGLCFTVTGETPSSGYSRAQENVRREMLRLAKADDPEADIPHWTLHDLRRTTSTNLAALGVRLEVAEKLLNHRSGRLSGVAGIYNRHSYAAEVRTAMDMWGAHVAGLVSGKPSNVVPMVKAV